MSSRAFAVGDQVRVVENSFQSGKAALGGSIGTVKSVDTGRRRTEPYYIYYVELPGETMLIEFEYRELELVATVKE